MEEKQTKPEFTGTDLVCRKVEERNAVGNTLNPQE